MQRRPVLRLALASSVAAALVAGAAVQLSPGGGTPLGSALDPAGADAIPSGEEETHDDGHDHALEGALDDGHGHEHDPALKNAISRAGESAETQDPTSPAEAADSAAYVEEQRALPDPPLTTASLREPRTTVPGDRYAMAGGCYAMGNRRYRFQATDLGSYLLYGTDRAVLAAASGGTTRHEKKPSARADWTVTRGADGRFRFRLADGRRLRKDWTTGSTAGAFDLRRATGCPRFPEVDTNVTGLPHAGTTPFQEVRGYVDPHIHGMVFEFLGGRVHCGRPWHRYGAPAALVDCPDHTLTLGKGAVLESLLSGEPSHDPVGWPTFKDWPAPNSLTHEGMYWKWTERSWRGGQRLIVNLLTENNKLCELYPLKKNSCDDMDSIRLQAKRAREMERYIDAQYGGPGKGFYRIVTTPWEARKVINSGRMAVVLGIETSVPFGCTQKLGIPQCSKAAIDRQLQEVWDLGVRQMELVNKFDNALAGVAGDEGEVGVAVNSANFLETLSFWRMRHCDPADGESHDKNQSTALPLDAQQQDALFGALAQLTAATQPVPVYGPAPHCNAQGLTGLGAHLVDRLADRGMLVDPDHMSVKARNTLLDQLEARRYSGVLSTHSWSTPDAYPRIYELGGFVAPYAGDSEGFFAKWQRHLGWADRRYYFGFGFGADINGLGAQGDPRGADVPNPVTYPFEGLGGVTVGQQRSGERVYDINADGVSHYGLYPDWVEDLRQIGGATEDPESGDAIVSDLARGTEAYLQTWERAVGIRADACRNPDLRLDAATFRSRVTAGMTPVQVMRAVGQPWQRHGSTFVTCARSAGQPEVRMEVTFDGAGRVVGVRRKA